MSDFFRKRGLIGKEQESRKEYFITVKINYAFDNDQTTENYIM